MRLKKIRLAGFKSFVEPTNIPFPDDMTAIVGPNGCGKSNVIDAVRWVLGESSAKNLRGDAMTDVIFNGSSSRKPVSQCSVELVFDNSSQRIQGEYAGYQELSIKRVVTREAQSTYYLNNTKCRRRDVTDLFLGTGLGPRSYAIIEQGMISRLIESKPQELRVFIEEAAGISKYKERRRETENRMRHTRDNLERLGDVRAELGQQLEKLQRQAAAARRYKDLKAKERRYKAELATIRWLHHSDKIAELERQIQEKEVDIEAYIAKQRGDEKEITELKEQQSECKQRISDTQHKFYLLGNDITRIEQNQLHAKQRREQITKEQSELAFKQEQLEEQLALEEETFETLSMQLEEFEPEYLICEESLMEAEERVLAMEDEWLEKQKIWRNQDHHYLHVKQQSQSRHSQIQTLLQVQLRTEQRIREINSELSTLIDNELQTEIEQLRENKKKGIATVSELSLMREQAQENARESKQTLEARETDLHEIRAEWQAHKAQLSSTIHLLNSLDSADDAIVQWREQGNVDLTPIWDYLDVEQPWQLAVECALQQWESAYVCNGLSTEQYADGVKLFFNEAMTQDKPDGSLAQKCRNRFVPEWLARIEIVDSIQQAMQQRASLPAGFSFITQTGEWVGEDWLIYKKEAGQQSQLALREQVNLLKQQIDEDAELVASAETSLEAAKRSMQAREDEKYAAITALQEAELQLKQIDSELVLLKKQQDSQRVRQEKLSQELSEYNEQLEQEKMQMEELSIQVEEFEMQLAELQDAQNDAETKRAHFEQELQSARSAVQSKKSQLHELQLRQQSLKHQLSALTDKKKRLQDEMGSMAEKASMLVVELVEFALPMEAQQEQLQIMLQEQEALRDSITELQQNLSKIEHALAEAEKGQGEVMSQVSAMRNEIQSVRLECERNRERSNGFIEQLQEMQQPIKNVLETLPEEYSEQEWKEELEKTSNALGRLGAVNLAAVEEFEVQSERKQHLDEQNDDLTSALETLENAIRKIDKETRTRFKETFEKVNADVKILFPKVFGGGAAYLDLTGEDLLETGVTIMARPPGKKNSTIHLLSGGEKALTALSLVFAIFRLNPAPFCLLDEVDAPLDDANVGRFCKLVSEMSKTVQFIYITHNKIAMEMAYHLTGVTMAEPGVSRIVAVDVEEAVAIANA
ncbi:MAG: chromosome segregation protein SMC [Alteromonadaceae bacterium]|nr:chromosome segregation protein SMC [Alteromonadaceae bacterium]